MSLSTSNVSTTKMTSKGQVVIPEEIRDYMHLESGVKFIVMAAGDSIVFKKISPIPTQDLKSLLKASRQLAKEYSLEESEITETIKTVRTSKRKKALATKEPNKKRTK